MTIAPETTVSTGRTSPTEKLLTASLVFAPVLYLVADATYAARGWEDGVAGVLHVLGAIAYGFVVLRIAAWLTARPRLGVAVLVAGLIGMAGNVAYGFDTIHASLGDTALVDQPGVANLIKPLGLFCPLSFVLIAIGLVLLRCRWQGVVVLGASILWPIAHIGNVAWLAVVVNALLVIGLGAVAWTQHGRSLSVGEGGAGFRSRQGSPRSR
jgi:hypothetical protein